VTYTQLVHFGGLIPKSVVNNGAVNQLMFLSRMRKRFDKSLEVDGSTRTLQVEMIQGHDDEYSAEEEKLLDDGDELFAAFSGMKATALKTASPLTTAKIAFRGGDNYAWGWATATVRASPEEVLAFLWDARSRTNAYADTLEVGVDEEQDHTRLIYVLKAFPKPLYDRDVLTRCLWKKQEEGGYLYSVCSEESEGRPQRPGIVRAKVCTAARIARSGRGTKLDYIIHPDAGGRIPNFVVNATLGGQLAYVSEIQEYFQAPRGLDEWDADDARAVGEAMCLKTQEEKHPEKGENKKSARMRELFKRYRGLGEIGRRYEFFQPMMARVVQGTLKPAGDVKSKLCSVSLKEGETIGRGLAMALASNLTAESGVEGWVGRYDVLTELDRTEAWFR